ncbi:hypothetical protein D3C75_967440 [compost metagenome]
MEYRLLAAAAISINPAAHHYYTFLNYSGRSVVHYPEYKTVYCASIADTADCWPDYTCLRIVSTLFPDPGFSYGTMV